MNINGFNSLYYNIKEQHIHVYTDSRITMHDTIEFIFHVGAVIWFVWLILVIKIIYTTNTDVTMLTYLEGVAPFMICAVEVLCLHRILCNVYPDPCIASELEKRVRRDMAAKRIERHNTER